MSPWISHFGLAHPPFTKDIDDHALWLPTTRRALVDELLDALRRPRFGRPHRGARRRQDLRAACPPPRAPPQGFRLTYCHNATLGRRDFYRQLCLALGLSPSATAAAVFYAVSTHIEDLGRERVFPVFLLDESHLLHQDTLDHLHIILLNYEWDVGDRTVADKSGPIRRS